MRYQSQNKTFNFIDSQINPDNPKNIKYSQYLQSYYHIKKEKPFDRTLLVIWIAIVMVAVMLSYILILNINNSLIRKDCASAIYNYNEYNIQPEELLVKDCAEQGIEFAP